MSAAHHATAALAALLAAAPLAAQQAGAARNAQPDTPSAVPGTHRHFFVPTGRTLPAGTWEVGAYQILAPYIGYALHDRVMIATGTPLFPEAFARYWYIAPKLGLLAGPRLNAAVGGLILADLGSAAFAGGDPANARSVAWAVVTWGGSAGGVTLGTASDMGGPFGVPRDWLILTGAELRIHGEDSGADPDVVRLVYEGYHDHSPERTLEGLHLVGMRWRSGRVTMEVMLPIQVEPNRINALSSVPLVHVSFTR